MIYYPLSASVVNMFVNVHAGTVDSKYLDVCETSTDVKLSVLLHRA